GKSGPTNSRSSSLNIIGSPDTPRPNPTRRWWRPFGGATWSTSARAESDSVSRVPSSRKCAPLSTPVSSSSGWSLPGRFGQSENSSCPVSCCPTTHSSARVTRGLITETLFLDVIRRHGFQYHLGDKTWIIHHGIMSHVGHDLKSCLRQAVP